MRILFALPFLLVGSATIAAPGPARPSLDILKYQVVLDRMGFSPGVIDGHAGRNMTAAVRGFQASRGLPETGTLDPATARALSPDGFEPVRALAIAPSDAAGPFIGPLPKDMAEQAKLPGLGYATLVEKLAEKFHTTPATIAALNPGVTRLAAGQVLKLPNVLPPSRAYPDDLTPMWRATLDDLNVAPEQPAAARITVDKSDGLLRAYDASDRLIAQFPATMGSRHDPLPIGKWTIKGRAYNPPFHYNPKLFWDADSKDEKAVLKPGPNSPVGVVWIDLSKPHYGIHGTPNPEKIGRTESHGCIRLTNWDAARLAMMVKPGTPAVFQE